MDYLQLYNDKKDEGYNEYEAMGIVAGVIAIRGTQADLRDLYNYHITDFLEETRRVFNGETL